MKDELEDLREALEPTEMTSAPMIGRVGRPKPRRAIARDLAHRRRQRRHQHGQAFVRLRQRSRATSKGHAAGTASMPSLRRQDRRGPSPGVSRSGAGGRGLAQPRGDRDRFRPQQVGDLFALQPGLCASSRNCRARWSSQLTIAPSGEITDCRIVSTELNDARSSSASSSPASACSVSKPRTSRPMTTTKPIEFFPA